jgi:arabinofuranosyltransferase
VKPESSLGPRDWPWLTGVMLAGILLLLLFSSVAQRVTGGQGGAPLDDAWIHFQFARNLARGDGFSFNPGEPTSGSTAPLWTVFLAGVYALGGRFPTAGQYLSGLCFLATLAATYWVGQQITGARWAAGLASGVVAVNGRMVWAGLSALETCLFAALSLLAIGAYLDDRRVNRYRLHTAALFGLAALSRPEGYLLFAFSMADFILHRLRQPSQDVSAIFVSLRQLWQPLLLFAALVLPYLLFSLRTSGRALPNTYHAKATVSLWPSRDFLSIAARYLILDNALLLPFYVLGVGAAWGRARLLSLWSVGLPLAYAFLHAVLYQHGRYLMPLIPVNALLAVLGLLEGQRLARRRGWRWRFSGRFAFLSAALVIAGTAWRLPTMARLYAWNVHEINQMHVAVGRWIADHTPPDAVLALNDIGAIAYVSERRVLDLAGLVTPEAAPILNATNRDARLLEMMIEQDVDYVAIFPNWFPGLAAREDVLEPVYQMTLDRRTIAGGETMVVYRAHWTE